MMLFNKRIMVVVAHPDDELLGLGATMHRLIKHSGAIVHVVILGEGITSRGKIRQPDEWVRQLAVHKENINQAKKTIGYHSVKAYDLPDNRFDTVALLDIVKLVEEEKKSFRPTVIFTHHGGDVNIDHQRTFESVITACRPMKDEEVKHILTFETPSGTEWRSPTDPRHFLPNMFFGVAEEDLQAKNLAMECYEYEKREYPHPRSPEALRLQAQRWGVAMGCEFAEAFCLVRSILAA